VLMRACVTLDVICEYVVCEYVVCEYVIASTHKPPVGEVYLKYLSRHIANSMCRLL